MRVGDVPYRSIWLDDDGRTVVVIDQTRLPHDFETVRLRTVADAATAIRTMQVRGAPLIGATAAYGLALALSSDPSDAGLGEAVTTLRATRPTAVNLTWALERVRRGVARLPPELRAHEAYAIAQDVCEEDVELNRSIGRHGLALLEAIAETAGGRPLHVQTHCNAGWLATVDWGTALAPVYMAHDAGIQVHVWVDETRPRRQGARLTAWELGQHGVPHTLVADSAGGHLMRTGQVDIVLVGTDRTAANGDVANKIGTYTLALAAHDNRVPFYVAAPSPSIDFALTTGTGIPIEERAGTEMTHLDGVDSDGVPRRIRVTPESTPAANFGFDVTPARLVTGFITERGVSAAADLARLFPERSGHPDA